MWCALLIDAAPGFEDGVFSALEQEAAVRRVTRIKAGNFDGVAIVAVDDAAALRRLLDERIWFITGVRDVQALEAAPKAAGGGHDANRKPHDLAQAQ